MSENAHKYFFFWLSAFVVRRMSSWHSTDGRRTSSRFQWT